MTYLHTITNLKTTIMKNLIKIQDIVMTIQEGNQYKCEFHYTTFYKLKIKTPYWSMTQLIKEITEQMQNVIGYIQSNNEITILETEREPVE